MEPSCLFCLETIQENTTLNPIGCPCKILAHKECFQTWFDKKKQIECPICHTVSIPNRIMLENIHIIYINTTTPQRLERQNSQRHDQCIGFCCLLIIIWAIAMTILTAVTGQ